MTQHVLLALVVLLAAGGVAAQSGPDDYDALLTRLRAGDTDVDYGAFRLAYTRTAAYAPYGVDDTNRHQRMAEAAGAGDFATARELADTLLEENYTDIDAHVYAGYASQRLDDAARADFHAAVIRGLVGSIMASGSGDAPDSPYVVISVDEEYALMRVLGLQSQEQGLTRCAGGHQCDRVQAVGRDGGEPRALYFDVAIPMQHMADEMGQ